MPGAEACEFVWITKFVTCIVDTWSTQETVDLMMSDELLLIPEGGLENFVMIDLVERCVHCGQTT